MEGILDWGIAVVVWLQQFSPALDLPFRAFTFMGEEDFFMMILPFLYWCLESSVGARLTILFLFSTYANTAAKLLVDQPRPFEYDAQARAIVPATGGGLPSGHTQSAVVVWLYLASQFRRRWLWIVAVVLVVMIPLSRVYLGVHFPTDLLGGYVLGGLILGLYLWLEPGVEAWLGKQGLLWSLVPVLAVSLLMFVLIPADEAAVTTSATLLGMGAGFALERRWVGFASDGLWWKRLLRLLLGLVVLFGLRYGLKAAFDGLEPEPLFRFLRYAVIGLWGGLGAPWVFVLLHLAERRPREAVAPSTAVTPAGT